MKIYTKTGDSGKTSLYDNTRVEKDSIRVESYGTIDELISHIGFSINFIDNDEINGLLKSIQYKLFNIGGELATKDYSKFNDKITKEDIVYLEDIINKYMSIIDKDQLNKFILPGSNKASGALHICRTVCRRAERRILTLSRDEDIRSEISIYMNRLSDAIYAIARYLETDINYIDFEK